MVLVNDYVIVEIRVRFKNTTFTGSEVAGFVLITLEVVGVTSANPFTVTVTPSEQSPVSAKGNILCVWICVEWRAFD